MYSYLTKGEIMATIDFQIKYNSSMVAGTPSLHGSGVAFFGPTQGSSVQINSYQDSTYISNGDATSVEGQANNNKFIDAVYPSGMCTINSTGTEYTVGLSGIKSMECSVGVRFGHTSAVNTQNCQLRVYDRNNINSPASGVNTKVAEIVNFNGSTYDNQGSQGVASAVVGSGDAFWWGEEWPSEMCITQNYYENSLGTQFYNGLDTDAVVNGDQRLSAAGVTDNDLSVGGSGIIVPLLDSPGSGQRGLAEITDNTTGVGVVPGLMWPKWSQYVDSTKQATLMGSANNFGNGHATANIGNTYGGTGLHTHHTWCVALSASPLSLGSKEQYGIYVSLEYL